ncbi:MAG: pilus assembly protein PilM [Gammaproteobacteria bacterium]
MSAHGRLALLPFFKSKKGRDALTAVTFAEDGIALARIRRAGAGPAQLLTCEFHPHEGEAATGLREALSETGTANARCTTLMGGRDYQLLLVEAPDVEPSELRAAIRWRIKDLIDFHIDDAVIDVIEIPGQDRGRSRMMYAVVARASRIRARIDEIEDAGLELTAIDVEELALRNLTALLPEDERGSCLLWFGPDYGSIQITRGGELFLARRIDVGAAQLLAAAQHGDPDVGDYGEPLAALLEQVTLEIQRSLDYYDSHFAQPPVQAVFIAPTAPELAFLNAYLGTNINIEVRTLELDRLFPDAVLPDPVTQARCLTAIGAALRHEELVL